MIYIENIQGLLSQLKERGEPFKISQTLFTKEIETEDGIKYKYIQGAAMDAKELFFINRVKKHIESTAPKVPNFKRSHIKYIGANKMKFGHYYNAVEIDLTGAYWEAAHRNNFITEEIYLAGKEVSKKARLIALGNLAKTKTILTFNGSEYGPPLIEKSRTEAVFFYCAYEVDTLLNKCILLAGNSFLFYWVDAIFLKDMKAAAQVGEFLYHFQHPFKYVKDLKVIKKRTHIEVTGDGETRPFYFQKNEFIK